MNPIDALNIDEAALDEEMRLLPHELATYGGHYANALRAAALAHAETKRTEAELSLSIRAAADANGKKTTEASVQAMILTEPSYQQAQLFEIEADCDREKARAVFEGLRAKRDMLIQIASTHRAEARA